MEIPVILRDEITRIAEEHKQNQLKMTAKNITEKYKNESGQGKHLVSTNLEALVYAVVRMPATFSAVSDALNYALESFGEDIHTVLDVGAGTGAASWAVRNVLGEDLSFTCLEREDAMLKQGKQLGKLDPILSQATWIKKNLSTEEIQEKADLVVVSYALNELSQPARIRALEKLWKATNKLLIIIEPGTVVGSSQIRFAKDYFVNLGGHIVAPCPSNIPCPMAQEDWCHFTTRIPRSKLHKALKEGDVPYEDEKFSFIAVSKIKVQSGTARVLRHPIKEAGKITLQLCTKEGILQKTVTKKDKSLFKQARKASSGDAFEY